MKRKIFFWLERLKITPSERKTITALMILLVIMGGLNMTLSPSVPFENGDYHELEKQFEKRTAMLESQEQELMEQYFPPVEDRPIGTATNSISSDTTDSTGSQKTGKKAQDTQKQRINVNKADVATLESLPGIGPTYAGRIVEYRKRNDGFESLEELKKIKGIAEKRLEKLKPFIKLKDSK